MRAAVRGADCAPGHRCLAARAGHPFTVPIDGEGPQLVTMPHAARDAPDGPFEPKAVVPSAAGQQSRIHVSRVDEVLAREQALGGQALVDLGRARPIRPHRGAAHHGRDQVRGIVVAGFRDGHLVPGPAELPLQAEVRLGIVGRLHPFGHRRQLRDAAPPQPSVVAARVVHPPDVAQRPHHRPLARRGRCIRRVQGVEQDEPVRTDVQGERFALLPALGETVVLDATAVALEPDGLRDRAQPIRRDRGQVIEGGAECLGHPLEKGQIAHGSQHVCAVGALLAAGLDEAARLEALQHGVQQQGLGPARDEAGAELG